MYHIMSRSISEVNLFNRDEDKRYYLLLLKRYCDKFHASIYAYCLMDNHVHLYINPNGADISTFMHSLNSAYVAYFNRKYKRHGHLFQGRFASTIVDSLAYSLTLSAYIHNNCKDIPEYHGREEQYPFSSYGIYLGIRKDKEDLVDTSFILRHFSENIVNARKKYELFVEAMKDTGIIKEIDAEIFKAYLDNEYRSEKKFIVRDKNPEELLGRVCEILGHDRATSLYAKYRREKTSLRAFAAYVMRVLCGCTYKEICRHIGNLSLSGVVRLTGIGYRLCIQNEQYQKAFALLI